MKQTSRHFLLNCAVIGLLAVSLVACSRDKGEKGKEVGQRISILTANSKKPKVDEDLKDFTFNLSSSDRNMKWEQVGGNAAHNILQPALGVNIAKEWSSDIGYGLKGDYRHLSSPVVADGKIFTLDAKGKISAFDTARGKRIWKYDTTPQDRDDPAMGGGLAVDGGKLFVTTGFGEVIALNLSDGSIVWRKSISKPSRAAPTVADGKVYAVTIDNELHALDAQTGESLWRHSGIAESATLMGASSPAVSGDSVVVTYSSGEIYSLRAQNGRAAWSDVLASAAKVGALPAIADIRGLPVIDNGRVFAVSHSGRMAAIDLRTGDRAWDLDIGGTNTPQISGNTVFVLSNDNELFALVRESGRVIWTKALARYEKPSDFTSDAVFWFGPVLAGGRLWLTNSLGNLVSFDPENGEQKNEIDVGKPMFVAPIVADNTLFVVTNNGYLIAFR